MTAGRITSLTKSNNCNHHFYRFSLGLFFLKLLHIIRQDRGGKTKVGCRIYSKNSQIRMCSGPWGEVFLIRGNFKASAAFLPDKSPFHGGVGHHKATAALRSWKDSLFIPLFSSSSGLLSEIRAFLPSWLTRAGRERHGLTTQEFWFSVEANIWSAFLQANKATPACRNPPNVRWRRAASSPLRSPDPVARCSRRTLETVGTLLGLETLLALI